MPENKGGTREGGKPIEGDCPVLYLLHGHTGDEYSWIRGSRIEQYVNKNDIAVVMPGGLNSFYVNSLEGSFNYFDFLSEELPNRVKQFFHVSNKREDTFIAGLSMGGYGAFKQAFNYPEKYAAAASMSGALDMVENDLLKLSTDLKKSGKKVPILYQCCGVEDCLYPSNSKFRSHLKALKYDFVYYESPGGHDWDYWDSAIQKIINWLPIRTKGDLDID